MKVGKCYKVKNQAGINSNWLGTAVTVTKTGLGYKGQEVEVKNQDGRLAWFLKSDLEEDE
jgi:hypothetical protein